MRTPDFSNIPVEEYDSPASYPEFTNDIIGKELSNLIESKKEKNESVIMADFGCGLMPEYQLLLENEFFDYHILKGNLHVKGVEQHPNLVQQAQKKYHTLCTDIANERSKIQNKWFLNSLIPSNFTFDTQREPIIEQGNMYTAFDNESIDLAVAFNTAMYKPEKLLKNIHRTLKKNGKCLINFSLIAPESNTPEKSITAGNKSFTLYGLDFSKSEDPVIQKAGIQWRFSSYREILQFIEASGFIQTNPELIHTNSSTYFLFHLQKASVT